MSPCRGGDFRDPQDRLLYSSEVIRASIIMVILQ